MCAANDAVVKLTGAQLQNADMKVKDMTDPRRNPAAFVAISEMVLLDLDAECVRVLAASNSAEERAENRLEQREGANAEALANAARTDAAHPRGFMKGDAARIADPPDPPRRCSRRRTSRRA